MGANKKGFSSSMNYYNQISKFKGQWEVVWYLSGISDRGDFFLFNIGFRWPDVTNKYRPGVFIIILGLGLGIYKQL